MKSRNRFREVCRAFVQTPNAGDLDMLAKAEAENVPHSFLFREFAELQVELKLRKVETIPFHPSDLAALFDSLPSPEIFVACDLAVGWTLLQRLGMEDRITGSYPNPLRDLYRRRTWQATRQELAGSCSIDIKPLFVKPCRFRVFDNSRYRGRIVETLDALDSVHPSLTNEPFFCSEVVGWLSEYRCYVLHSQILGICPYRIAGIPVYRLDCSELEALVPEIRPTDEFVQLAIKRLDEARQSVAAYCLDFGLSTLGEMSLIEMNDGLALLNYGISSADYLDLHMARWRELMEECRTC